MDTHSAITIDEFELLPDALALNHELVHGELVDVSGNTPLHNRIRDGLGHLLANAVEQQRLGLVICEQEFDFDGNAHGPDVAFIAASRLHMLDNAKRVQRFVPDFAVEVVSTNDKFNAVMKKAARYRACGTREVWILEPENRQAFILCEQRSVILNDTDVLETPLIPGFSIRLGQLLDRAL